jgi:hypothetical protein
VHELGLPHAFHFHRDSEGAPHNGTGGYYFWAPGLFSMPKRGFQIVKNHFQKMPGSFLPVQTPPKVFANYYYKYSNDSQYYKITLCYAATGYA